MANFVAEELSLQKEKRLLGRARVWTQMGGCLVALCNPAKCLETGPCTSPEAARPHARSLLGRPASLSAGSAPGM